MQISSNSTVVKDQIKQRWLVSPMLVPNRSDLLAESNEEFIKRHERFLGLAGGIKYKLAFPGTGEKIQTIGKKYGFELLRLANITRLIREYYFGEVRLENFSREIEKRMSVSLLTAQEIARYIKAEIIDWDPWAEYLAKLPKASAREIVAKYPKVADKEITGDFIELKDRPDDIFAPSIKNWLRDYTMNVGQANHSDIIRMNYLFHTENTKGLTSQERDKLGIILKSFDENIPLAVDTENQEIIFEYIEKKEAASANRARPQTPTPTRVEFKKAIPENKIKSLSGNLS